MQETVLVVYFKQFINSIFSHIFNNLKKKLYDFRDHISSFSIVFRNFFSKGLEMKNVCLNMFSYIPTYHFIIFILYNDISIT